MALSDHLERLIQWSEIHPSLGSVSTVHGACTVSEAYRIATIVRENQEETDPVFRLINTGTIDPFRSLWGDRLTKYLGNSYKNPVVPREELYKILPRRHDQAGDSKIIIGGIGKLEAFFDSDGIYMAGKSTVVIRDWNPNVSPWYILGVLNSDIARFFMKECYAALAMGGSVTYSKANISQIPIPADTAVKDSIAAIARKLQTMSGSTGADAEFDSELAELNHLVATAFESS